MMQLSAILSLSAVAPYQFNSSKYVMNLSLSSCNTETGVDYSGNDVKEVSASSAEDCCSKCGDEPQCKFFSYATDGTNGCFLKSDSVPRQDNPQRVSGSRPGGPPIGACPRDPGYDYFGSDIRSLNTPLAGDCCNACLAEPQCKFFSYATDGTNGCFLKTSNSGRTLNAARISGSCPPLPGPSPPAPGPSPPAPGPSPPAPGPSPPAPGPLPPIPDKVWFGWWGGKPNGNWDPSADTASLIFDPIPSDADIDKYGGQNGVRFLYPAFLFFCQEQQMTGACTLFGDYQSRWNAAVPKLQQYLRDQKILGFTAGDERLCGKKKMKTSLSDWNMMLSTIRNSFPRGTSILFTNECGSTFEDGNCPFDKVPDTLDWIGFDHYRKDSSSDFFQKDIKDVYEQQVYPKLNSHQKIAVTPEVTHDDEQDWKDCDDKCRAKVELQDAHDFVNWQKSNSRIAFVSPYRLDNLVTNNDAGDLKDFWNNYGKGTK